MGLRGEFIGDSGANSGIIPIPSGTSSNFQKCGIRFSDLVVKYRNKKYCLEIIYESNAID